MSSGGLICFCSTQSIGLAASHVLAGKIALNNMSENATCQLVFSIVTMIISVAVRSEFDPLHSTKADEFVAFDSFRFSGTSANCECGRASPVMDEVF